MLKTIISALALTALVVPAFAAENWTTDLPAALQQAAKEKKLVLVDFNGSDWCGPCIQLKRQVLNTSQFSAYAKDKFLLVDIDLPRWKKIGPELLKTNQALEKQYAITGFPSVFVMNTQGIVVGGLVGGIYSIPRVQGLLDEAIINAAKLQVALEEAAGLEGVAKAKLLSAIYQMVPGKLQGANATLLAEIKALDIDDSLGFKKAALKEAYEADNSRISANINALHQGPSDAIIEFIDKELANGKLDASLRGKIAMLKGNVMISAAESLEDLAAAKAWMLSFAKTQPSSAVLFSPVEKIFADPAKLLEEAKRNRVKKEAKHARVHSPQR